MRKEVADKWVKALRSGKYEQGRDSLNSGGKFCCLGVLCDISGIGKWEGGDIKEYICKDSSCFDVLPHDVKEWAGMGSPNGRLPKATLIDLNDFGGPIADGGQTAPLTFDEIADIIQMNWEEL